jgi:excisionase family DNA binding protein
MESYTMEPLMTQQEVADVLQVKVSTLYKLVRSKRFPAPDVRAVRMSRYCPDTVRAGIAMLAGKKPEPVAMPPERTNAPAPSHTATAPRSMPTEGKVERLRVRYSQEQKANAIARYKRDVVSHKMTAHQLSAELGIPSGSLTGWYTMHRLGGKG